MNLFDDLFICSCEWDVMILIFDEDEDCDDSDDDWDKDDCGVDAEWMTVVLPTWCIFVMIV